MTAEPQRKNRTRELFDLALERPATERSAFLTRECAGDVELRRELDLLLSLHVEAKDVLRDPTGPVSEEPGDRIGHFRLLQKIGEGGFGTVWMAEQEQPVRRKVALKVLKAGMDTAEVVARFEAERQALALMAHPNIAQVFDGGATPHGRPYFVMELVRGVPITRYCDEAGLSPRERLELFLPVCQAVQHAHFKGVIHRDLKPGNVLVTLHDGVPVPKVIDFGIAKATQGRLTERTLFTRFQQLLGTPEYMAPEQAELSGLDVDTRADVYSLGVLLYELLTGTRPFDFEKLVQAGYAEMLRTIKEVEPQKPSTRVSTLGDRLTEIARHRQVQPRALGALMRGELDWIVMKTLEKERHRRYATAAALAEDLQRHLRMEPVQAGPPSRLYRLRKYVQRHRVGVAALLVITGGTATSMGVLGTKHTQLSTQNAALDEATQAARESAAEAQRLEHVAKANSALAEERRIAAEASAEAATEQRARAERETARVLELAAFQTLDDLTREAAELWPAEPALVERYREWMRKAEGLVAKLPEFRASLAELEQRAAQERARSADAEASSSAGSGVETGNRWWRAQLLKLIALLEAFEDPEKGLMRGVAQVHGWGVEQRLEFASTIAERTVSGAEARGLWSEAIEAVAASPKYGGLELTPQLGLLPIGADPHSGLWEFAHLQTGAAPKRDADGRLLLEEETGLVFVLIPGGTFWMGAQSADPNGRNYDPQAREWESPVHEVTLSPYFLSKYEMTQGQWQRFTGSNPSHYHQGHYKTLYNRAGKGFTDLHPVANVTWTECVEVLGRMRCLLPTEPQWEYGCRAGTGSVFWSGDGLDGFGEVANVLDAFAHEHGHEEWVGWDPEVDDGNTASAEVGSYRANAFGLHDMHGNVYEWCQDGFVVYPEQGQVDPVPWIDGMLRILRGGNYRSEAFFARSSARGSLTPATFGVGDGVRPARALWRPGP